ncbi:MAG: sugar ABC transporter permease [bacterium]
MEPKAAFKSKYLPYLLLAPSNIVIVVFLFYPALETFRLALYRSDPFGFRKMFVGLDNFLDLLTSPDYGSSVAVTFLFTFWVVVFGLGMSLALAVLANQKVRGIRYYRTAMIWPYALSTAIAGALWAFLFDPTSGVLNYFFASVFDYKPPWLTSGDLAFWVIVATTVWKNMGYNIVFFLAGLQNIPDE